MMQQIQYTLVSIPCNRGFLSVIKCIIHQTNVFYMPSVAGSHSVFICDGKCLGITIAGFLYMIDIVCAFEY